MKQNKMKTKNILALLGICFALVVILTFSLTLVSADKTVNYNIYQAIIEDNGSLNKTTQPVNGINAILYNCTGVDSSGNCTTVGRIIGTFSSSTNVLSIVFPEVLQSQYGYVIYVYKGGYIGWEQRNVIRYGNGTVNSNTSFYLSKKRSGYAPIMNLSVLNEVEPHKPIEIGVNISIDADTYSAIRDSRVSNITLNETVETKVTLEITNSSGNLIFTNNKTLNIPYSGYLPVNFTYSGFNTTGDYTVKVYTDVTDEKILNSIRQSILAQIRVIEQNLTNYTYTLIQNLNNVPRMPNLNENVNFSFDYLSNYVDSLGNLTPVNTSVYINIYRYNNSIYSDYVLLPASNNSTVFSVFSFSRAFNETGSYLLRVRGVPNSTLGNQSIEMTQELQFSIGNADNGGSGPGSGGSSGDKNREDHQAKPRESKVYSESLPLTVPSEEIIDLTPKVKKKSSANILLIVLIILIILLIVANVVIYYLKFVKKKSS